MGDILNNFMTGKKKYSASVILPIIVAAINVFVTNTETANTLVELVQEFLPTIIALVGGAVFTVVEGVNDNSKIKASTIAAASTNGTVATQTVTTSQPAQTCLLYTSPSPRD